MTFHGEEEDKSVLFHCGPAHPGTMAGEGKITDHPILANAVGTTGSGYGCREPIQKILEYCVGC